MDAIEQSSIQTSDTMGSAATTTAKVAVFNAVVLEGLHPARALMASVSDTGNNLTGCRFLEEGASSPASNINLISSSDNGDSPNILQL